MDHQVTQAKVSHGDENIIGVEQKPATTGPDGMEFDRKPRKGVKSRSNGKNSPCEFSSRVYEAYSAVACTMPPSIGAHLLRGLLPNTPYPNQTAQCTCETYDTIIKTHVSESRARYGEVAYVRNKLCIRRGSLAAIHG